LSRPYIGLFTRAKQLRQLAATAGKAALLLTLAAGAFSAPANSTELELSVTDNLSAELGFPLYTWASASSPQAIIVAIHGATLHGRSYSTVAQTLSQKGYSVFAPDMRGFGAWYHNSAPTDSDAKHVIYSQSEADLFKLITKLRELYPGKAIFLMGESVGANMAIRLMADHPNCAEGMILSGAGIKQRIFFGPHGLLQMLTVFFVNPHAQLDIAPYIKSRVSESKDIANERVGDPLGRTKLDVVELFKTRFFNKDCLKLVPQLSTKTSVLVLEGDKDRLFHADDIEKIMSELPCEDKTLHLLKDRGHINLETAYVLPEVNAILEDWLADKTVKFSGDATKSPTAVSSAIEPSKTLSP